LIGIIVAVVLSDGGGGQPAPVVDPDAAPPSTDRVSLDPAPDFELATLTGEMFCLEEHPGHVLVLNFRATWCAPCREEIPDFVRLQNQLNDRGLQFVGISVDLDSDAEVREFAAAYDINYPIIIDDETVAPAYRGNFAVPSTFLVDGEGRIRHRFIGVVSFETMIPKLDELLAEVAASESPATG
jgi:peroxiredoxin